MKVLAVVAQELDVEAAHIWFLAKVHIYVDLF
jgi:hypothetical protein